MSEVDNINIRRCQGEMPTTTKRCLKLTLSCSAQEEAGMFLLQSIQKYLVRTNQDTRTIHDSGTKQFSYLGIKSYDIYVYSKIINYFYFY